MPNSFRIPVDWNNYNDCYGIAGCKPNVSISFPANGEGLIKSELSPIDIRLVAWSPSGELQSLKLLVDGTIINLNPSGFTHEHSWTPPAFGKHTILAETSDGTNTSADTCVFDYTKFNPDICGHPLWNKDSIYKNAGTLVSWDGNIYQNKWWTQGNEPGTGAPWDNPWTYLGQCPTGVGLPEIPKNRNNATEVTIFPSPVQNGRCTIRFEQTNPETEWVCYLKDQTGRSVVIPFKLKNPKKELTHTINLPSLSPGVYFLLLISDQEMLVRRLVVQ